MHDTIFPVAKGTVTIANSDRKHEQAQSDPLPIHARLVFIVY
jgi:hypothetical protein